MEALRRAANSSFEESISAELRIAVRLVERNDIHEGVRALLVDRDNCPIWNPRSLAEVSAEMVDSFFAPFEDPNKELRFDYLYFIILSFFIFHFLFDSWFYSFSN